MKWKLFGSGYDLIQVLSRDLTAGSEENRSISGQRMSRSLFERVPSVSSPDLSLLDILARLQCRYIR
jgi:hypothetical protein